jgi:RNA polymerase sigma factor (sigma-70 family)
MVTDHLPLVHRFASKIRWGEYDDRVQDGCIGLMRGVRRFEGERGLAASTYLGHCIKGQILEGLRIREGTRRKYQAEFTSLSKPIQGLRTEELTVEDTLVDDGAGPEDAAVEADERERIRKVVLRFPVEERRFIGAMAGEKGAKSQLSRDIGCSEANVTCRIRTIKKVLRPLIEWEVA